MEWCMRSLVLCLLLVAARPACAGVLDLGGQGMAWSAAEVQLATQDSVAQTLAIGGEPQVTGCRTHCGLIWEVWTRLLDAAQAEADVESQDVPGLRLIVVQAPDVEAFAAPDGRMVLGEAFVRERRLDEARLAFVLAHELAHVLLQHERQTLTAALALLPHNVTRSVPDIYVEMDFNLGLVKNLEVVMQQTELEADETGLYLAALAGYEPRKLLGFLEEEASREQPRLAVVATHPEASVRAHRLEQCLPLAERFYRRAQERLASLPTDR